MNLKTDNLAGNMGVDNQAGNLNPIGPAKAVNADRPPDRALVLKAEGIDFAYRERPVLQEIDLAVARGELVGILGPNGVGKSTLLRVLSGHLAPSRGEVRLKDRRLASLSRRMIARGMAFVPQIPDLTFPFTCREVVAMGRFARLGHFGLEGPEDREVVDRVMDLTGTRELADRSVTELSGGEQQRVMLAQALAQEGEILLLDEPTSHLDIRYQVEVMDLLHHLNRDQGITVILTIHQLNLAARYCARLVLLDQGRIAADGSPDQVLTFEILEKVFHTPVLVEQHPHLKVPQVTLLSPAMGEVGRINRPAAAATGENV